ncbi:hypothetical protein Salbus254_2535 [Streptomyces albidoflavus]|nr:hypothetical protein Salbus254_2535 [Streptomyces albidoflavus]
MPGTPELPALRRLLVDSLIALAADAPAQATWARRHGVPTDEFALAVAYAGPSTCVRVIRAGIGRHGVLVGAERVQVDGWGGPGPRGEPPAGDEAAGLPQREEPADRVPVTGEGERLALRHGIHDLPGAMA